MLINLHLSGMAITAGTALILDGRSKWYSTELLTVRSSSRVCRRSLWTDIAIILNTHYVKSCVLEAC